MKTNKTYLPYLAGLAAATIFGLSFMFTKQALDTLPTVLLLAGRFTLAAILLTSLWLFGILKLDFKSKPIKELMLLSLFQPIIYFICETVGVRLTSSSEAGIMIALIPVVVTIFAALFLNEKTVRAQFLYILTSVLGVVFIVLMSNNSDSSGHFSGTLFLFSAVFAASAYNILSRKLSTSFTPVEITFAMMWTGAIVFGAISLISGAASGNLGSYISALGSAVTLIPILYLGVLSSVCAFFMQNYMLSKLPASNAAVFSNLTTVISIVAGVFIRHEAFHWYQILGGIMIIVGVWGTNRYNPQQEVQYQDAESL